MSTKGYLKVPREKSLLYITTLKDKEYKLFNYLLLSVDWDVRHRTYGSIQKTIRQLGNELRWSVGTTFNALAGLEHRHLVKKENRRIFVVNFEHYQGRVHKPEQTVQLDEFDVHSPEFSVLSPEQKIKLSQKKIMDFKRGFGAIPK